MQALFDIILPVFVVIGFGYVVAWRGLFSEAGVDGLVKFTQNFAIPCLLFRAISQIDLGASVSAPLILSYYIGAFASFFAGYFGARVFFERNAVDAVAIGFCCLFSNTVLLGLPITERAYGPEALSANFAIISFHAPLCYMLGVTAMEIARSRASAVTQKARRVVSAMFHNPFVIAILLGLFANITDLPLPIPLLGGIDLMASAALPAALFSLGGILYRYRPEGDMKAILMVCAISLALHPTIVFGAGKMAALDQTALRSAVLTAAMAPGVNAYVFAHMYGAARRVAASSVLIATAGSIITIWLWLLILP
ncbi:MAG: AEC family transporter [Paracoccaceae bacterium]|nr:AEC family transporter [Paracoccaceae bacterium]